MSNEAKKILRPSAEEFSVPVDLLKIFRNDVRRLPEIPHNNGWIIFDNEMLVSVMEHGSDIERKELANQLRKLENSGGKMIIVQG